MFELNTYIQSCIAKFCECNDVEIITVMNARDGKIELTLNMKGLVRDYDETNSKPD